MMLRQLLALFLCMALVNCSENQQPTAPEDRMQPETFAAVDRTAISEPVFAEFRLAVMNVRSLEAKRPTLNESDFSSVESYAAFLAELEVANRTAATFITADGWSREQRKLMQRTLRSATMDNLTPP